MAKLRWPNSVLHYGGTTVEPSLEAVYGLNWRCESLAGLIAIVAHFETETTTAVARYTECLLWWYYSSNVYRSGPR